jgi:hypothetical protein
MGGEFSVLSSSTFIDMCCSIYAGADPPQEEVSHTIRMPLLLLLQNSMSTTATLMTSRAVLFYIHTFNVNHCFFCSSYVEFGNTSLFCEPYKL